MKIYISGPTKGEFKIPVEKFKEAQDQVRQLNIGTPTIPQDLFDGVDVEAMEQGDDVKAEIREIMESRVIVLLPGWEKNVLCTLFKSIATSCGVTVKYYEKFIGAHIKHESQL